MKTTSNTKMILVSALFALATSANATSWRINNDVTKGANFASINAAMSSDDVQAGDTLYMDPGCSLSDDQTVSKQVTIIGPGYFRTDTPHRFAYITGSFYLTAAYIKVEGVYISGHTYIFASYCTMERCRMGNTDIANYNHTAQYCTIRQCYLTSYIHGYSKSSVNGAYATIENCIVLSSSSWGCVYEFMSPTIRNNYLKETANYNIINSVSNATITNNVLINTKTNTAVLTSVSSSIVANNVMSCAETTYSAYASDNKFTDSTDESLVFALEGTNDQRYQLKEDSPAKGYATDGGDCGPFGGLYPYVLNGLPKGHPYYTKAIIGSQAKDGKINVSLNIQMQND